MGTLTVNYQGIPEDEFGHRRAPDEERDFHNVESYGFTDNTNNAFFYVKQKDGSEHAIRAYRINSYIFTKE
jgi:hypothetical protein